MPKITGRLGTGMTERGVVRFDTEDPGDIHGVIAAGVHALDRSSFERLSRRLGDLARQLLEKVGLPSDAEGEYLVTADDAWPNVKGEAEIEDAIRLPLAAAVQGCGYPPDSPQGYATRLLTLFAAARQQLGAGHLDDAMALAFAAGELVNEAGMKEMFEKDFLAGERVHAGGRKSHVQTYGTEEEKAARWANYVAAFDDARIDGLGMMEAYAYAAKKFGVDDRTIRRAVKRRNKQR